MTKPAAKRHTRHTAHRARWIWSDPQDPAPRNRFTYFRAVVDLKALPADGTLRFAADSNARLWINGTLVCRKEARYQEEKITAEVIDATPYLHKGRNVVVALHHNWGDIITFQRTGNRHAGLYLSASWLQTDASWRWHQAPEFIAHEKQVVGLIGDPRIRYPILCDGQRGLPAALHTADFDDSQWSPACIINDGPWPSKPADVETPGQREYGVPPMSILAAGQASGECGCNDAPFSIAAALHTSKCCQDDLAIQQAQKLLSGQPVVVNGHAGETHFLTVDFGLPVHGYPSFRLEDAPQGALLDLGYCEIWRSQYSGEVMVDESGWLNPESVVGKGYADRYITRAGQQSVELPDERTARWLTLHVHFEHSGTVILQDLKMVHSQYPIAHLGSFECGDERINQIVKLCQIHAEVTMSDAYVDTPGREDGQWLEDAQPRALLAARWYGDTRLRELLLRTHAEAQGAGGNLHPFAPSNYPAYPAPYDWSVQWVAMLYDDYLWSGDPQRVRRYWPALKRYWAGTLKNVNREGLFITPHVLADLRVGQHPEEGQSSGIVTPWIIERLRWSAEMAQAIGEEAQAERWQKIAARMTTAFRKYHLLRTGTSLHVADRFDPRHPRIERGYSQAGQTVAVYANLLTTEEAQMALRDAFGLDAPTQLLHATRWNNPTYAYRALRALSHAGFTQAAVQHLLERYAQYLPAHPRNPTPLKLQGPYGGPLPEYWVSREDLGLQPGQVNTAQPADDTGSHGWGAVPLLWLHESLLGVQITESGGGKLRIAPQAGGLPYVQGYTATPKGVVWVSWQPLAWQLEIVIPAGVIAEVVMPPECEDKPVRVVEVAGKVTGNGKQGFTLRKPGRYVFQV
jgi:hypothetical protein